MYLFIEPMLESDVPRVQEIERQSFSTPWSAATYLRELRSPHECRYIVVRGSTTKPREIAAPNVARRSWLSNFFPGLFAQPVAPPSPYIIAGYGGVWLTVNEGHITTIATAPEMRRRGVGELALNGLIDAARDLGAEVLTLEVRVSNVAAQKLYLKYGFAAKGVRHKYYTDNNEDALIMWTEQITTPEYQARLHKLRMLLAERLHQAENEPFTEPS